MHTGVTHCTRHSMHWHGARGRDWRAAHSRALRLGPGRASARRGSAAATSGDSGAGLWRGLREPGHSRPLDGQLRARFLCGPMPPRRRQHAHYTSSRPSARRARRQQRYNIPHARTHARQREPPRLAPSLSSRLYVALARSRATREPLDR